MSAPRWSTALLRWLATPDRAEDVLGDLEEVHRRRVRRHGRRLAGVVTGLEALEMAVVLLLTRIRGGAGGSVTVSADSAAVGGASKGPPVSWLDIKLGVRMLRKYPGLTLVGGLAMAFAIWVCAGVFEFVAQVIHPTLPLEDGDRIVSVQNWDMAAGRPAGRSLHDLATWRRDLGSVRDLGAYRPMERNLVVGEGRGDPVAGAEISASAFRVASTGPFLGRTLVASDEAPGAPSVAVVGYDLWRSRFGGDPDVVGRTVRLGGEEATVVGVMPEGFGFPVNQGLWVPLGLDPASYEPGEGPGVVIFGRLVPGVSLATARAELDALQAHAAAERPDVYEHLVPRILPWADAAMEAWGDFTPYVRAYMVALNVLLILLLVLISGNVALLMFARAATREGEIAVRTALGASRRRIVGQLFAEALVLGGVAAAVGLGAAGYGLRWGYGAFAGEASLPFWFHASLSPTTVVYASALTVLGAAIAGAVPALKVTRGGVDTHLRRATPGGGGVRFGGVWTAVIVIQVAVTVTFPAVAFFVRREAVDIRTLDVGFPDEEYLSARLTLDPEAQAEVREAGTADARARAFVRRFEEDARELAERLEADASVAGVTFGSAVPGTYHTWRRIELDAGGEAPRTELDRKGPGRWVPGALVATDFFEVLGADVLAGRGFRPEDAEAGARVVIVNQSFVDQVLGGRNPVGRRLRYLASGDGYGGASPDGEPGPWYRIVGVVKDLGMNTYVRAGFYHPARPGPFTAPDVLIHVNGDPGTVAPRLRAVAAAVDPTLGLDGLQPVDHARDHDLRFHAFWFWLLVIVSSLAVLLSLTGIYSVMSFTVARRTREIGVRVALGGRPSRIAGALFRRPALQVGAGILGGWGLTLWLSGHLTGDELWSTGTALVAGYAGLMMVVCATACVVPMRRALAIEPSEALREE